MMGWSLAPGLSGRVAAQPSPQEMVGTEALYTRHQGSNVRREMEGGVRRVEERGRGTARNKTTTSHWGTGGTDAARYTTS